MEKEQDSDSLAALPTICASHHPRVGEDILSYFLFARWFTHLGVCLDWKGLRQVLERERHIAVEHGAPPTEASVPTGSIGMNPCGNIWVTHPRRP